MRVGAALWGSLKARVTLFTLAIFTIGIWSLAYYSSRLLRDDMQRLLGEQQYSTASFIAAEISQAINERFKGLRVVADRITPAMMANPAHLQDFLNQRHLLGILFNAGMIACNLDGTVIADAPSEAGRIGVNYIERDNIAAALKEGKSSIGKAVMGKKLKAPVFGMSVPIRDPQGRVVGVLTGVLNLGLPSFLDTIASGRYGNSGGYILVDAKNRLVVTASNKQRVMESFPAVGVNPMRDRLIAGYEGSVVMVNALGVQVLASTKQIPVAGWFVGVTTPTTDAFAPIREMQEQVLFATVLLTLLAGGLSWWMLKRQLSPLFDAVKQMAAYSDADQHPQPLPITTHDEIGELIGGFNRLLESINRREVLLRESEERFRLLVNAVTDYAIILLDTEGRVVSWNSGAQRIKGYADDEIIGRHLSVFYVRRDVEADEPARELRIAAGEGRFEDIGLRVRKDGSEFWANVVITPVRDASGVLRGYSKVTRDISERKRQEDLIREHNALLTRQKAELEATLGRINRLEGLLSICMSCKKIRAGESEWQQLEKYITEHSDAAFSHGLCPECLAAQLKDLG